MQASTPGASTPLLGNDSGFQLGVRDNEFTMTANNVDPGSGGMSTSNVRRNVPDFTVSTSYTTVPGKHTSAARATRRSAA